MNSGRSRVLISPEPEQKETQVHVSSGPNAPHKSIFQSGMVQSRVVHVVAVLSPGVLLDVDAPFLLPPRRKRCLLSRERPFMTDSSTKGV